MERKLTRTIKLYCKTIVIPVKLIFRSMLKEDVFPNDSKKSNEVPIHQTDSKNLIKNYRPIRLLLLSAKCLKDLYLTPCSIILYKTNYSLADNLASFQAICVLLNSYKLRMKSAKGLIVFYHTI